MAAADVLNYLGDLAPAFAAIRRALRPGGAAAVSLEAGEGATELGEGLRYRHGAAHVAALAEAAGLRVAGRREAALRRERGEEVAGTLWLLAAA